MSSTIAAISTAPGSGALAVIRLSGPEALSILKRIFTPSTKGEWRARYFRLGEVRKFSSGQDLPSEQKNSPSIDLIDEALAVYFPAPNSFTGEEIVEIHGHGGPAVAALTLTAALNAGAKLAAPGEFTQRAFQNGRLDLTQAEAVADLIAARSQAEVFLAAKQLQGSLAAKVEEIHRIFLDALVNLEGAIDFSEDLEPIDLNELSCELKAALPLLTKLLDDGLSGRIYKDGLRLALAGAPNVGKSSLLNALTESERALVSSQPGTTRDYIVAEAMWEGLRIELIDTAGLSEAPVDELDARGQERSRHQVAEADLVLGLKDATQPNITSNFNFPPEKTLIVWNKIDLAPPPLEAELAVSAKSGEGLLQLKAAILQKATGQADLRPPSVVPNLRHQESLRLAQGYLQATIEAIDEGLPPDICAYELRSALDSLGRIRGETSPEDLLREIFSRFCLGK